MKIFLFLWIFLVSMVTQAQSDSLKMQSKISDSTSFGTPDGKLISKEIGADGGQIISEDGRVELIFPAGALAKNTIISIQPRTNPAPNGVGKSYWFEPSGIQFQKPVQINFRYTNEEEETCPPDWMSLGIQDHKGKWTFIDYESFDSVSKTLKGFIHHFSGVSNIDDIRIVPDKQILRVNEETIIMVIDMASIATERGTLYDDTRYSMATISSNNSALWYANDVLHGNDKTGRISEKELVFTSDSKFIISSYKAPPIMTLELLENNPVEIWLELYRKTRKGKVLRKRIRTFILLIDEYDVKVTGIVDNTKAGPFTQKWTDECSFRITVGKALTLSKISLSDTTNNTYKLEKENYTNNRCTFLYQNSTTCKGLIHVVGMSGAGISGGSADPYVTATIDFVKTPWEFPKVQITCRGESVPTLVPPPMPAYPRNIKFQLKPGTFSETYIGAARFVPDGKMTITIKQVTE